MDMTGSGIDTFPFYKTKRTTLTYEICQNCFDKHKPAEKVKLKIKPPRDESYHISTKPLDDLYDNPLNLHNPITPRSPLSAPYLLPNPVINNGYFGGIQTKQPIQPIQQMQPIQPIQPIQQTQVSNHTYPTPMAASGVIYNPPYNKPTGYPTLTPFNPTPITPLQPLYNYNIPPPLNTVIPPYIRPSNHIYPTPISPYPMNSGLTPLTPSNQQYNNEQPIIPATQTPLNSTTLLPVPPNIDNYGTPNGGMMTTPNGNFGLPAAPLLDQQQLLAPIQEKGTILNQTVNTLVS